MTSSAMSSALQDDDSSLLMVDVQNALHQDSTSSVASVAQLTDWANLAYSSVRNTANEVTIRLVEESEITLLNRDYRSKDKPTNVLSFPFESEFDLTGTDDEFNLLGDVIICHSVIVKEAGEQAKSVIDHYAHMVVHGILHLCGYDHDDDVSAEQMEALETQILALRGIANPYR